MNRNTPGQRCKHFGECKKGRTENTRNRVGFVFCVESFFQKLLDQFRFVFEEFGDRDQINSLIQTSVNTLEH